MTTLATGSRHNCWIRPDGTITCWGADGNGQSTPPGGTFTAIAAGDFHTCAISTAGGSYTCGLRTDGTATCWGLTARDGLFP